MCHTAMVKSWDLVLKSLVAANKPSKVDSNYSGQGNVRVKIITGIFVEVFLVLFSEIERRSKSFCVCLPRCRIE